MDNKSKRITKKFQNFTETLKNISCFLSFCYLSLSQMFTLLPQHAAKQKIGQLEAVKLNLEDSMVCVEDQKESRATNKNVERQLNDMEEETSKLADSHRGSRHQWRAHEWLPYKAQAYFAHGLGEEPVQRCYKKEFAKSLSRSGCTLAMCWSGNRFTERRWRWSRGFQWPAAERGMVPEMWDKPLWEIVWPYLDQIKTKTRHDRSLVGRIGHFAHGAAQSGAGRSATDSMHCRLWWKDNFPQFGVFRNCGGSGKRNTTTGWSMSLSWCRGFFCHPSKRKRKLDWILQRALWRARLHEQWKLCCVNFDMGANPHQCRLISTTFFSPWIYCNISFEKILSAFSLFPSIFKKKISRFTLFFWKCFPWS